MICVARYIVLGKSATRPKVVKKFGDKAGKHPPSPIRNVADARQWRVWLKAQGWPHRTKPFEGAPQGLPLAYRVYNWGGIKGEKHKGEDKQYGGGLTFYPGFDASGERLPVSVYGRLDLAFAEFGEVQRKQ